MKDPNKDRTKVVVRHLPPGLSQSALKEQVDSRFAGRYDWFCFRPGKTSHRRQVYSRAYIDFRRPEDVFEFSEAFGGHVFVNEKGTHYKAQVEYAPSQRVPKILNKKDSREGSIFKDSDYLEFLEMLAKPTENLPSADIQLERKEAERAASGVKESCVVTPLMDFVRQKRAAKGGSQRNASSAKLGRRAGANSIVGPSVHRRGLDRRRYVLRDSSRIASGKEKSAYVVVSRPDEQAEPDKTISHSSNVELAEETAQSSRTAVDGATMGYGNVETGKKKLVLLKNKDKEPINAGMGRLTDTSMSSNISIAQRKPSLSLKGVPPSQPSGGSPSNHPLTSPARGSPGGSMFKNQRREPGGRGKGGLVNKDFQQSPQSLSLQAEHQNQTPYVHRDIRKSFDEAATSDLHAVPIIAEKPDRSTKNRGRPDRPMWTARRRANGFGNEEGFQSVISGTQGAAHASSEVTESDEASVIDSSGITSPGFTSSGRINRNFLDTYANQGEMKSEKALLRMGDSRVQGSARITSGDNGIHRQILRRPVGQKEVDGSVNGSEAKSSKRGGASGHGEKQVWVAVQKPGSNP